MTGPGEPWGAAPGAGMMGEVTSPVDEPAPVQRWQTVVVAIGGALAIFLLGATAGMLIGVPGAPPPAPAADSVDVGFSQDMTVHHEQAVEMAAWTRDHSTDPAVRGLAYDIESQQTAEIGRMQGWLTLWGASALPSGPYMTWMAAAPSGHGHGGVGPAAPSGGVAVMPGMASAEDLRALKSASGQALDVLFLQLILRHHEGGAAMLNHGAEYATTPAVRAFAAQVAAAQATESGYVRALLAERGAAPLPA